MALPLRSYFALKIHHRGLSAWPAAQKVGISQRILSFQAELGFQGRTMSEGVEDKMQNSVSQGQ